MIDVQDDSHLHSKGKETHFRMYIVSDEFSGTSYVDRHKKIMNTLKDNQIMQKIHAISIVARTEEEHDNSSTGNIKSTCYGGHKQLNKKLQMNQKPVLTSDKYFDQVPDLKKVAKEITLKEAKKRKLTQEFSLVKAITSTEEHHKKIYKKNRKKNRYVDVVAFGHNLVTTDRQSPNNDNYIHANYLQFEQGVHLKKQLKIFGKWQKHTKPEQQQVQQSMIKCLANVLYIGQIKRPNLVTTQQKLLAKKDKIITQKEI